MIKFLVDYTTKASEPEAFTAGSVIDGRPPASELHFVSRRVAAFLDAGGRLTDAFGKELEDPFVQAADQGSAAPPPALPDPLDGMNGAQLREAAKLEKVTIGIGVTLDGMRKLIRDNRADLAKLDRDVLIAVAAAEQIEISAEADDATLRDVISAARVARATA
ncbi:hypothetical protein GGR88_001342 [Sphingomonas jejuensis]|uniref:Uncharacterized protein n=1 Tax=Sphingomonas jejuensis TaxID=904715 RepID=A0ABX0XKJ9_9SPHN|nr:hypothetical protein [Sphingomonas jejuensis]NJC33868.1 hypothetical protein [Sphingomonas jejuensis]